MESNYHIVNKKSGVICDVSEKEVLHFVTQQHMRNDPAMSWARARELASSQCTGARETEKTVTHNRIEVTIQGAEEIECLDGSRS